MATGDKDGGSLLLLEENGEKTSDLRDLIRSRVTSNRIQGKIRECVDELERRGEAAATSDRREETLLRLLEERGLVEEVMAGLTLSKAKKPGLVSSVGESTALKEGGQFIHLQVLRGRAFVDHLSDVSELLPPNTPTFTLHVYFGQQRFRSSPTPCCCEPHFNEMFLLELPLRRGNRTDPDLLALSDPLRLVLTKTTPTGDTDLVGTAHVDWREVLASPDSKTNKSVELIGLKADGRISPGVLTLQWGLLPCGRGQTLDRRVLEAQRQLEQQRETERKRLFLLYAKQWWAEFVSTRSHAHSQRLVKVFAEDERGNANFVCRYVTPLRVGRLLEGPRHAARFVSLLEHRDTPGIGEGGEKVGVDSCWQTWVCLLSTKNGSVEDHCTLLCSLLLGYGLDAYVCIGTKTKGLAHTWVLTCNRDGSVIFWESLTGQRFHQTVYDPDKQAGTALTPPTHPYRTIGCVFNHQIFYANNQPSDSVLTCKFNFNNKSHWKRLTSDTSSPTEQQLPMPPLIASTINADTTSNDLEQELKALITQHRLDCGLPTQWNPDLAYLLGPALSSYELERREGACVGVEEFQEAIKRYVPEGHTFKGFPIQFNHFYTRKIFVTCLKSPVGGDIIGCRGDSMRLAVHVKVYDYPENVCAVWCMLGVTYRSVL